MNLPVNVVIVLDAPMTSRKFQEFCEKISLRENIIVNMTADSIFLGLIPILKLFAAVPRKFRTRLDGILPTNKCKNKYYVL